MTTATAHTNHNHSAFDVARLVACRYILDDLSEYEIEAMHTDDGLDIDDAAVWFEADDETLGICVFRNLGADNETLGICVFRNFDNLTLYRYADGEKLRPATRIEAARSILAELTEFGRDGAIDIDGTTCYAI